MPWPYSTYPYRKRFLIGKTYLDASLTDFPLLVQITSDPKVGAHARSDGHDIRFYDAAGNSLSYERVSFAVSSGLATGTFWVKCNPSTSGNGTYIWMYYGDADAADGSDADAVWDANFKGVWHMGDAEDTSHIHDSTANANHGTKKGAGEPAEADAKVGKGQDFDGTDDYISLGNIAAFKVATKTISWWARPHATISATKGIFSADSNNFTVAYIATNKLYASWRDASGTARYAVSADNAVSLNEWHHYAIKFAVDGSNVVVTPYIDGAPLTGYIATRTDGYYDTYGSSFYLGAISSSTGRFDGDIDELRFSASARSAAWIKFEYHNQADSGNCLTWDGEEAMPTLAAECLKAEKDLAAVLEVLIKRRLDTATWTLTSGKSSTYELSGTFKDLAGVKEFLKSTKAETAYAVKTSIDDVEATASTYYYDAANHILYVHTSTDADPDGGAFLLKATAWRYFCNGQQWGSKACYLDGHWYDPRLAEDSIPDASAELGQLGSGEGGIKQTWGSVKILNGDGYYDAELGEWIWQMCLYYLKVGVPGALYSDWATISRGRTGNLTWDDDAFTLACEDQMLVEGD